MLNKIVVVVAAAVLVIGFAIAYSWYLDIPNQVANSIIETYAERG